MGMEHLEQFLKWKKEEAERNQIDREQIKKQWLNEIESFYKQIKSFLAPLQEKQLLSLNWEEIKIQEENLGEYTTKKLHINFPDQKVVVEPVGKYIIGANGRIDMIGKNENVRFLLVDKRAKSPKITVSFDNEMTKALEKIRPLKDTEYAWKIATPPPNIQFIDLNEDSFSDALLGVIAN
ncbi:hypothetical protein [Anoxybacteroides tepidamans]|uniref:hypothetical protein n=1 Tax=Anoxybacteroides tepidamans TaxID=265948 RepID=UPI001605B15F|nr:hypothetical protein [Anoxybacillus tepidamans]